MGGFCRIVFFSVGIVGLLVTLSTALSLAYYLSYHLLTWYDLTTYRYPVVFSCDKPFFTPLLFNIGLLLLFVVQHSFMASRWWKSWMKSFGWTPIERSLYVIATCVTLNLVLKYYESLPLLTLWSVKLMSMFLLGRVVCVLHLVLWAVIFLSTLGMDFLEFVGLRQVIDYSWQAAEPVPVEEIGRLKARDNMRHSGIVCFVAILWLHPVMSVERLLMAIFFTLYSLFGHHVTDHDYSYVRGQ